MARELTKESTAGLWALPQGMQAFRVSVDPWPKIQCLAPPATYKIRRSDEPAEVLRDVPVGPVLFNYGFASGLPGLRADKQLCPLCELWEIGPKESIPLRIGNVGSDGLVCWGSAQNKPASPLTGWSTFWSAPFNDDLTLAGHSATDVAAVSWGRGTVEEARRKAVDAEKARLSDPAIVLPDWAPPRVPTEPPPEVKACDPTIRGPRYRDVSRRLGADPVKNARRIAALNELYAQYVWGGHGRTDAMTHLGYFKDYILTSYQYRARPRPGLTQAAQYLNSAQAYAVRIREGTRLRERPYWEWMLASTCWEMFVEVFASAAGSKAADAEYARLRGPAMADWYGGGWRSQHSRKDSKSPTKDLLAYGKGIEGPASATHAVMSSDPALLRLVPKGYRALDPAIGEGSSCPHAGCEKCSDRGYLIGYGFRTPRGTILAVVFDPHGMGNPPVRVTWTEAGGWELFGPRAQTRRTPTQKKRDRHHVIRMRALLDRDMAQWIASRVTQTPERAVVTQ